VRNKIKDAQKKNTDTAYFGIGKYVIKFFGLEKSNIQCTVVVKAYGIGWLSPPEE
jgi:hypothetical protein